MAGDSVESDRRDLWAAELRMDSPRPIHDCCPDCHPMTADRDAHFSSDTLTERVFSRANAFGDIDRPRSGGETRSLNQKRQS